ncbi:MAG: hypothetical protein RL489_1662 [Pseudomonadota bacterium]|jgi:replication fork clamp-binding protein CrfC
MFGDSNSHPYPGPFVVHPVFIGFKGEPMHEDNIANLREEALRLIQLELASLEKMKQAPGLLSASADSQQTFDQVSADAAIKVLQGEAAKLEKLDMVLAVVGTMKAGKSTTINAIVGTEVLPNRNTPMTAIPTLIRHVPGQKDPVLHLTHREPLDALCCQLQRQLDASATVQRIKDSGDADLYELALNVREGKVLPEVSEGAAAIFQTLKGINDLVRLSGPALLNIDFPFDEYSSVANLPVICVEFAHLEEKTGGTGTLTLLDTPGPNEAGQDRLRPMLKEQLSKASAVLAVMDYTQLKSEADAQVRADLLEIAEVARGRLYALVNKFDQSDRNGMKADAVKQFVQELMSSTQGPVLQAEQVFPVSSRYAYLANRARHEVARHGSLPVPAHGTWVEDFGELAFGRLWESKIEDAQKVQKAAAALWNDSLFDAPLSGVIQMAHANAAVLAVDAASAKLLDYATKMSNQCTARETALLMDAKNLRELVQGLQDDIERIGKCEQAAKDSQEEQVKNFTAALDLHFGNLTQEVKDQLETYFQRGKHDEKARNFKRRQDEKDQEDLRAERNPIYRLRRALQRDFGHGGAEQMHPADPLSDFDPSNPVIKFETDQKAAQALLTKIEASVGSIFGKAGKGIEASLDAGLQEFEASFQEDVVEKARDVLDAVLRRLEKDGLGALQLELPQQRGMALHLSGQQMLAEALETRTVNRTRLVHQSGFWGGLKRAVDFFGNEWGQDRRSYQEEHYNVDLSKIREKVLASADASFKGLHAAVASQVKAPLARAVDQFFEAFRGHVEVVRGDLLRGLSDKSEEESQQRLILNGLRDLQKDLPGQRQDAEKLKAEISGVLVQQQVTG